MTIIKQLGTFDLENYGDLLYPLVFEHILRRRDERLTVHQYSLLNGDAPQKAGFLTRPIQHLFARGKAASKLVIGGGDILRTDWGEVAAHYEHAYRNHYGKLRRLLGLAGFARYLLRKRLGVPGENGFYVSRFRRRWMNYPAPGPFLISPEELMRGSRVSYLSCGVPFDFAPAERGRVKRAFDGADFIYLRDEESAEKLRRAGVRREICVAPDLIVMLSELFDRAAEARKGRDILSTFGVNTELPILCFQSMPFRGFREAEIIEQLKRYAQRTGTEIALLPLGFCHGDHEFLRRLSKESGGVLKLIDVYSIFDANSVIAACDLFVGTSLHGNITAFSYGIPHLIGPVPFDKGEGFLRAANLPPELKLRSWGELNEKIDMIAGLEQTFFSMRAQEAKIRVRRAVDDMLVSLLN
jgi:hypothetical protein